MLAAVILFMLPADISRHSFVLTWADTKRLPWGILILFGGGLALAASFKETGLIDTVGGFIAAQSTWSLLTVAIVLISMMLFMTELMSNVALVTILVPLVAAIAIGFKNANFAFSHPCDLSCELRFHAAHGYSSQRHRIC